MGWDRGKGRKRMGWRRGWDVMGWRKVWDWIRGREARAGLGWRKGWDGREEGMGWDGGKGREGGESGASWDQMVIGAGFVVNVVDFFISALISAALRVQSDVDTLSIQSIHGRYGRHIRFSRCIFDTQSICHSRCIVDAQVSAH